MRNLENKVVVITGAGSGIGRALALELVKHKAIGALTDINPQTLTETVEMVEKIGGKAKGFVHDISDLELMKTFAQEVQEAFGTAHVLINNAGVAIRRAHFQEVNRDNFEFMMDVNLWGPINCTKAFLPGMLAQKEGHIANVSSIYSMMGISERVAYCTAKFALRGFTETLYQDLAGTGVGVTSILPGAVLTNITKNSKGWENKEDKLAAVKESSRLAKTTPEKAARIIIRSIRKNKIRQLIGLDAWIMDKLARFMPSAYHKIVLFSINVLEKKREEMSAAQINSPQRV